MDNREISKIRDQFQANQWPKFLESVKIDGLRGWSNQTVHFKFPIVAIVGENGSGKSTILKAAACAFQGRTANTTFFPSDFFKETAWENIQNVRLYYRIQQGNNIIEFNISRKITQWRFNIRRTNGTRNPKRPERNTYILGVSRTLPIDATVGYAKIAKKAANEVSRVEIEESYRKKLSHILGRKYIAASFAKTDVDDKRSVGILRREVGVISQYHQGAGEDATLDLIQLLQDIPNYSLLIIDEVEASLHPKSQRRLIRVLLWFCRQKRVQIILSTHSPYVLQELPKEARIMLMMGSNSLTVLDGISPEFAMSRLDEADYPELNLYVEDNEAKIWLREIIATGTTDNEVLSRIDITHVGPANVVQMMGKLAEENKLPNPAIAFVDGDKDATRGCVKLPGNEAPEVVVFEALKAINWGNLDHRFGIGAGELFTIIEDTMLDPNHHNWNSQIGNKVRMSSNNVWRIIADEWCKQCLQQGDKDRIIDAILSKLP